RRLEDAGRRYGVALATFKKVVDRGGHARFRRSQGEQRFGVARHLVAVTGKACQDSEREGVARIDGSGPAQSFGGAGPQRDRRVRAVFAAGEFSFREGKSGIAVEQVAPVERLDVWMLDRLD